MAINGTIVQEASETLGSAGTLTVDSGEGWAAPTSGNILLAIIGSRGAFTVSSAPSGFSAVQSYLFETGGVVYWKVSDGSETSISITTAGTPANQNFTCVEIDSTDLDVSSIEDSAENETYVATSTNSIDTGSVTLSSAETGLAIAIGVVYRYSSWDPVSWSDSYVAQLFEKSGTSARCGVAVATRVLSATGSYESTLSTSTSTTAAYGVALLFGGSSEAYVPYVEADLRRRHRNTLLRM